MPASMAIQVASCFRLQGAKNLQAIEATKCQSRGLLGGSGLRLIQGLLRALATGVSRLTTAIGNIYVAQFSSVENRTKIHRREVIHFVKPHILALDRCKMSSATRAEISTV